MSGLGNVGSTKNVYITTDPNSQTQTTGQTQVGTGSIGHTGPVPDATGTGGVGGVGGGAFMAAVLDSMHSFMPAISEDEMSVMLAVVTAKMREMQSKTDQDQINTDSLGKEAALSEKGKKLEDAAKKQKDAIYKQEHMSIWDKIKAFFEAIFSVIAMVLGALLVATGIGSSLGMALLVGGTVGLVMAINDITIQFTGLGIAGNLDKLVHPNDPSSWAKADMGFGIALAVAGIIACFVDPEGIEAVGDGIAEGIANVAKMGEEAASLGEEGAGIVDTLKTIVSAVKSSLGELKEARQLAMEGSDIAETVNKLASVATRLQQVESVTMAVGNVVEGGFKMEVANLQSDAKSLQAKAKEMEALMQGFDMMIDLAIQKLQASGDRWAKMLESISEGMNQRSHTLSHAKFRA